MSSFKIPPSQSQVTFLNTLRTISLLMNGQEFGTIPTPIFLALCHFFHTGQSTIQKFIMVFFQEGWLKKTKDGYNVNRSAPTFSNLGEDVYFPEKGVNKVLDAFKAGEKNPEKLFHIISSAEDEPTRKKYELKKKKRPSLQKTPQLS